MAETPESHEESRKRLSRKLVLSKETLRKLEAGELRGVVGGKPTNGHGCVLSHPQTVCDTVDTC